MNYADLIALPASWSERSDATASAPLFITIAEGEMAVLRTRQMVKRADLTISGETSELPDDYLDQRSVTLGDYDLDYLTPEAFNARISDNPQLDDRGEGPGYYSVVNSEFRFWPVPVGTYTASLTYYAKPEPVAANVSNWILDQFPNLYTFGVLWACAMWRKDNDDIALYRGNFDRQLGQIQAKFADRRGPPLRTDRMFLQSTRRRGLWRG